MKKIIAISLSLVVIICIGWSYYRTSNQTGVPKMVLDKVSVIENNDTIEPNQKKEIDAVISKYLVDSFSINTKADKTLEAHELLGMEENNDKIYAYIWALQIGFIKREVTGYKPGEESFKPMVIVMEKKSKGEYSVIESKTPKNGEEYFSSVKEMFPEKYQDRVLSRKNQEGLFLIINEKISNLLKQPLYTKEKYVPFNAKLINNVKTSIYNVNIPKEWTYKNNMDNGINFIKDKKVIGGLDIFNQYSLDFGGWMENNFPHSSSSALTKGYNPDGYLYKVVRGELKDGEIHYFFTIEDHTYDLYFYGRQIDESTIINVAKSFKCVHPLKSTLNKDGTLQKASGYFQGNIDVKPYSVNINIKQTIRYHSELKLIYSDELLKTIDKLDLKYNDFVEVTYKINGYNQMVLMSINKIKK